MLFTWSSNRQSLSQWWETGIPRHCIMFDILERARRSSWYKDHWPRKASTDILMDKDHWTSSLWWKMLCCWLFISLIDKAILPPWLFDSTSLIKISKRRRVFESFPEWVLRLRVPGDPRSCQMDGRTISTNIDSWFNRSTCKRRPDGVSGRTLRWFCQS